jgi:hypothetical protein
MLNDSQKRIVSVTLGSLEEDLHDMERLMEGGDYTGVVHEMDNDIPAPAKDAMIREIAQAKDILRVLAERFSLERKKRNASRQCFARLTYNWTTLEEIKTGYLKGYGAVDDGLKDTLDPELDALIGLIQEMKRLVQTDNS